MATTPTVSAPMTTVSSATTDTTIPATTSTVVTASATAKEGYPTAQEAVGAEIPAEWVYQMADDMGGQIEYWSGPPQSEWTTAYLVEEASDGTWSLVDTWPLGGSDAALNERDEACFVVEDFLFAVMEDRAEDAHSLTVQPFANDAASASYGNGDFTDFRVISVDPQSDGTYWVKVEEDWFGTTDRWRYHVVPTEVGWRINDLRDW